MNRVQFGDCRDTMRAWAAAGVKAQMCVTSPPYFGLRSYLPDDSPDKPLEIGLEETPDQYIARMVEVFRCVRDVLADDGVLWLNLGDSYAAGKVGRADQDRNTRNRDGRNTANATDTGAPMYGQRKIPEGLKSKDLIGIPWMLAFALRADGWYLRQDIIWHKPNPMPESVTDRCTKAHEYIFLLSKSERYFYDHEAVKEDAICAGTRPSGEKGSFVAKGEPLPGQIPFRAITDTRNKRSVWTVATVPYKGAHFATFPPALIEPCILAGSRPGDVVLDPFFGSGTTGMVAQNLGRRWLGCELNPAYGPLQDERLAQQGLEFA